jgi:hypothetical protein
MKRFCHVVRRAGPRGLDRRREGSILRQHHDGNFGVVGAGPLQQFQAAKLRHLQIRDHDIDRILVEDFQGLLGGRRHVDLQAGIGGDIPA